MIPTAIPSPASFIMRIDPRARLVVGFVSTLILAVAVQWRAVALGLLLAVGLCAAARIPWGGLRARLIGVNVFLLMLPVVLPWSVPGAPLWSAGGWVYSREGLELAMIIVLKGNAIILLLSALIGTIDAASLAHALEHLRLPRKLVHLLIFTVRYLEVLHEEAQRLYRAARVRGFEAGAALHTYHTLSRLLGMLLVRSVDRSERILAAMKARGYCGRFYLLNHFHWSSRDGMFCVAALVVCMALAWMEWQ